MNGRNKKQTLRFSTEISQDVTLKIMAHIEGKSWNETRNKF